MFVFVHPALKLNHAQQFDAYDTARAVGREFSLVMAVIRLVNSGVFDRHPELTVHMAHLAGGIAGMLARIRCFQDKEFWGTAGNERHGRKAEKDFDHYIRHNLVFDTAGFAGGIGAIKAGLSEIPASRIVFATDYPSTRCCRSLALSSASVEFLTRVQNAVLETSVQAEISSFKLDLQKNPNERTKNEAAVSPCANDVARASERASVQAIRRRAVKSCAARATRTAPTNAGIRSTPRSVKPGS